MKHGLGSEEEDFEYRYFLYENDSRIKKFSRVEWIAISDGLLDYTKFFKDRENSTKLLVETLNNDKE